MDLNIQNLLPFDGVLRDFEIVLRPTANLWTLDTKVQPVSLVNSQITLDAILTQSPELFATTGIQAAPAGATPLSDTGQLAAGNWKIRAYIQMFDPTNNGSVQVRHRNAANTANIWNQEFYTRFSVGNAGYFIEWAEAFAANERVDIIVSAPGGAGSFYNAISFRHLLT